MSARKGRPPTNEPADQQGEWEKWDTGNLYVCPNPANKFNHDWQLLEAGHYWCPLCGAIGYKAANSISDRVQLGSWPAARWAVGELQSRITALETENARLREVVSETAQHAHRSMHGDKVIYPDGTLESSVRAPSRFYDCPGGLCKKWTAALSSTGGE